MADEKNFVSATTRQQLEELLAREANRPINARPVKPGAGNDRHFIRSSGGGGSGAAKIVRIPQSGLPAARDGATVGQIGQILPGVATCEIYQLNGAANPPTFSGTGTYLTVYNLRMVFMPGVVDTLPQYIPVVQEQDGYWLAINWWGVVDVWCDVLGLHVRRFSPGTTMSAPSGSGGGGEGFFSGGGSPGPAPPGSGSG